MNTTDIVDSLERCFISPNEQDSNLEPVNLVDVVGRAARNLHRIAHAITPQDAAAAQVPGGGRVGSLTEAVMLMSDRIGQVADSLHDVADAIRGRDV